MQSYLVSMAIYKITRNAKQGKSGFEANIQPSCVISASDGLALTTRSKTGIAKEAWITVE